MEYTNALVLGGGGSNGAWQAGVLTARLDTSDIHYDYVAGISVGALNGLAYCSNANSTKVSPQMFLEVIWRNIQPKLVLKKELSLFQSLKAFALKKDHILNAQPLLIFLKTIFKKEYLYLYSTLEVGYINMATGVYETKLFEGGKYHRTLDVLNAVYYSASFPLMFEPLNNYWDGGLRNNIPLNDAILKNPKYITIIGCSPLDENVGPLTLPKDRNLPKAFFDILKIMQNEIGRNDIYEFLKNNEFLKQTKKSLVYNGYTYKYFDYDLYIPKENLGNALDFDNEKANRLFTKGYAEVINAKKLKK